MEKEYIINQSVDEKTLVKASAKIFLMGRLLIYMVILIFIISVNIYTSFKYDYENVDVITFLPFLIPFFIVGLVWFSTKKAIHKNYARNPRYFNNITLTLSDNSLKIEGKDYLNSNPWVNYIKIKETDKWFLIFINKYQAHIIDKAQITNFPIEELRSLFRQLPQKIKVSLK